MIISLQKFGAPRPNPCLISPEAKAFCEPLSSVPAPERTQIEGGHRVQQDGHQIVLGQPVQHIHRHQQRLITLRAKEILRHTP